jgi:DNA-binding response OmpR family regulator
VLVNLLLVEDDPSISTPLLEGLRREGFTVQHAATGAAALSAVAAHHFDVVLLDLGLPDMGGQDVCRMVRETSEVPIIVVSARGEEIDRVLLLEFGADDYLVKPFGFRELVARIRAVLRRAKGAAAGEAQPSSTVGVGSLQIDQRTHTVRFKGSDISLTPKEYDLLLCLASDPGAVCSRDQLLRDVWDENWWGSTKTLDVHVASLRKKLTPDLIETVRSVGYRLNGEAAR